MSDWTLADLQREAPELLVAMLGLTISQRTTINAAIGRLVAQRDARIKELEREILRLRELGVKLVTENLQKALADD